MEMKLEQGDVRSVGGHDSQKYFFVRMCSEERADQVYESMRGGISFEQGFTGRAHSFKTNGQMKELNIKNVQFEVEDWEVAEAVGQWGEVVECRRLMAGIYGEIWKNTPSMKFHVTLKVNPDAEIKTFIRRQEDPIRRRDQDIWSVWWRGQGENIVISVG